MIEVRDQDGNTICIADSIDEAFELIKRFNEDDGKENDYYVCKTEEKRRNN